MRDVAEGIVLGVVLYVSDVLAMCCSLFHSNSNNIEKHNRWYGVFTERNVDQAYGEVSSLISCSAEQE